MAARLEPGSVVYLWPALVLVAITVTSFAESFALQEGGWMPSWCAR
ncbi:hypothetical protein [Agromyces flavus]